MEWEHALILAGGVLFCLLIILIVVRRHPKKATEKTMEITSILNALNPDNIQTIDYQRNKIVVKVNDIQKTNKEALKDTGIVGMNIIGDKLKFYYENNTEAIYRALKEASEGRQS